MERRRVLDWLIGAGVAVLVLVLAVAVVLWSASEPSSDAGASPAPTGSGAGTGDVAPSGMPTDLAGGEMWLDDLVLDAGTIATPDGVIHDVRAVGTDVRTGPSGMVAGALAVDATVPFALVATQIADDVEVGASGDQVEVVRSFQFAGRDLPVVATGSVEVVAGRLVIEPLTIDVGGPAFLSTLLGSIARELVTIEHEIEGLPEGLVLQDVTVQDDGFRAELSGDDVSIDPDGVTLAP